MKKSNGSASKGFYNPKKYKLNVHAAHVQNQFNDAYNITRGFSKPGTMLKGLMLSGPPGTGKSYNVQKALLDSDAYNENRIEYVKGGNLTSAGFYNLLWFNRAEHRILVLDDVDFTSKPVADAIQILSLLKTACESTYKDREVRSITAKLNEQMVKHSIPQNFIYEGCIIWITNEKFNDILSKPRLRPHFEPLVGERFVPIEIDINNEQAYEYTKYLIKSDTDMMGKNCELTEGGFSQDIINDVLEHLEKKVEQHWTITPRFANAAGAMAHNFPENWRDMLDRTFGSIKGQLS